MRVERYFPCCGPREMSVGFRTENANQVCCATRSVSSCCGKGPQLQNRRGSLLRTSAFRSPPWTHPSTHTQRGARSQQLKGVFERCVRALCVLMFACLFEDCCAQLMIQSTFSGCLSQSFLNYVHMLPTVMWAASLGDLMRLWVRSMKKKKKGLRKKETTLSRSSHLPSTLPFVFQVLPTAY